MDSAKPWYLSKTVLVNIVMGVVMALLPAVPAMAGIRDWIQANLSVVGAGWAVLGVLLRFISKDKVVLSD